MSRNNVDDADSRRWAVTLPAEEVGAWLFADPRYIAMPSLRRVSGRTWRDGPRRAPEVRRRRFNAERRAGCPASRHDHPT